MPQAAITSEVDRASFVALVGKLRLPFTVTWRQGKKRSLDQNDLQWLWASEAARHFGDRDATEMQTEWKLRHGVPILREDSEEFRRVYDRYLRPLSYEEKLEAIRHLDIGVSRVMTTPQMTRYLDAIQMECAKVGVRLTQPERTT